ncbi:hypothetical protein BACFRA24663_09925 [Bacteroides fragilis]
MNATSSNHILVNLERFAEISDLFLLLVLRTNHEEIHDNKHCYQHDPHQTTVRASSRWNFLMS